MTRPSIFYALSIAFLLSRSAIAQFSHNPSFGLLQKKSVTLKSRIPPLYNASGKTVDIVMDKGQADPQAEVEISLEQQLTQADSTIHLGGASPDLVIECGVSRYAKPTKQQSTQNGVTSVQLAGSLSAVFRIFEPTTKRVIKSGVATSEQVDNVSATDSGTKAGKLFGLKVPGTGPTTTSMKPHFHTDEEMRRFMIADVAKQVASYLVITQETLDVPLAVGGPLDTTEKLAVSGLWSRNLEDLETLAPLPDPRNDAYRLYDIGVANEALAYQATEENAAAKYLDRASIEYGKAMDAHPEEKNFRDAQNRIKAGLSQYTAIAALAATPAARGGASPSTKATEGIITNDDIIAMVRNKVDDANILDTIQTSPAVQFDLSPQGQIRLAQGGVNGKLLSAMKQRARATTKK